MVEGGRLQGESPERLGFLRQVLDQVDGAGLDPIDNWWDEGFVAGIPRQVYFQYLGRSAPASWTFRLPNTGMGQLEVGDRYEVDVIDTWNMTIKPVDQAFELTDVQRNDASRQGRNRSAAWGRGARPAHPPDPATRRHQRTLNGTAMPQYWDDFAPGPAASSHARRPSATHAGSASTEAGGSGYRPLRQAPATASPKPGSTTGLGRYPCPSHWVLEPVTPLAGGPARSLRGTDEGPLYTNTALPMPLDPPRVPTENPTGDYRLVFDVPEDWGRAVLRFQGVDSCGRSG